MSDMGGAAEVHPIRTTNVTPAAAMPPAAGGKRHGLLICSPRLAPVELAAELGRTWRGHEMPHHAAVLSHTEAGELDVVVAGEGRLGALVDRHGAGAAPLVGPVALIALALNGGSEQDRRLGPFRRSIRPSFATLAAALPIGAAGLLLLVGSAQAGGRAADLTLPDDATVTPITFATAIEPWLVARVDVDLRLEPTDRPMMADAS